jgi:malate dehydrogenase (oxaloacetate-decarboxylating)(NADP+)
MGIPIGKLQLYTACAAVPPDCLLPILLDTGSPAAEIYAKPVLLYLCKGRTLLLVMGSRYTSKP